MRRSVTSATPWWDGHRRATSTPELGKYELAIRRFMDQRRRKGAERYATTSLAAVILKHVPDCQWSLEIET